MKKIFLAFFCLCFTYPLHALPVGNPADPCLYEYCGIDCLDDYCGLFSSCCANVSYRLGFYGDYVFDRHLEVRQDNSKKKDIQETRLNTNAGLVVFNFCDFLELYGTIGATNISFQTPQVAFILNQFFGYQQEYMNSETAFSYSVGARAAWCCGCWAVGGEIQYFSTRPKIRSLRTEGDGTTYVNGRMEYCELQASVGLSYLLSFKCDFIKIVPYTALTFAYADLDTGNQLNSAGTLRYYKMRNDRTVGYVLGLTQVICERWSVTVEGRFVSETAFHINSQFAF